MPLKGMNQGVIQIGTSIPITIKQAAETIASIAQKHLGRTIVPHFDTSMPEGDRGRIADNSRSSTILGWKPTIFFEQGIEKLFVYIENEERKLNGLTKKVELQMTRDTNGSIPQMAPWTDEKEADAVDNYMRSGGWLTQFKATAEMERMLAKFIGVKHCFVVSNGTDSLKIMLAAVGVGPGDEVILPDWTMAATANVIPQLGAIPVFVDVDAATGCVDIDGVEKAITNKTKAIFHVSMNARSNNIERLAQICKKHQIPLLEDSAQALGSYHNGQHLGTFGLMGSFSFSAPKIITTGQGGAIVTNDDKIATLVGKLKDFGEFFFILCTVVFCHAYKYVLHELIVVPFFLLFFFLLYSTFMVTQQVVLNRGLTYMMKLDGIINLQMFKP